VGRTGLTIGQTGQMTGASRFWEPHASIPKHFLIVFFCVFRLFTTRQNCRAFWLPRLVYRLRKLSTLLFIVFEWLPYLGEISYVVRREMQRLVHRYAITPFQFRFIHETNKLNKPFTYKDKQNHLRRSSVVYKLTCTCGSNYIGQTRRNAGVLCRCFEGQSHY